MKGQKQDRKVFFTFVAMLVVCGLLGAAAGVGIVKFEGGLTALLAALNEGLAAIAPALMLAAFALCAAVALGCSARAKKLLAADQGDEAFQRADTLLGVAMGGTAVYNVLGILLFTLSLADLRGDGEAAALISLSVTAALFMASMLLNVYFQTRLVKQIKAANPGKRGNALDFRFEKDWLGSSDEAEKLLIYRASYQAYRTGQKLFPAAAVVLMLLNLLTPTGALPILTVGALWLAQTVAYLRASIRLSGEKLR